MTDADLIRLVYTSSANEDMSQGDIEHLLGRARTRNKDKAVTGLLLYIDRRFMQCLEGPEESVDQIFGIIQNDPSHHDIDVLLREPVSEREFKDWSMAFQTKSIDGYVGGEEDGAPIETAADPLDEFQSDARSMLTRFWDQKGFFW